MLEVIKAQKATATVPGFKDYFSRTWDQYRDDGSECAWMKNKQLFYTLIKVSAERRFRETSVSTLDLNGSGSTRPEVKSATESTQPRVNSARVNSVWFV